MQYQSRQYHHSSLDHEGKMAERTRSSSSSSRFLGLLITNLAFTNVKLGRGADATVYAVEWNGTECAAKRLHEILLEDKSSGGVAKLIGNFEAECLTWSKLRHPGVVQFLGVYLEPNSRLPVLVMEKMDISLRTHLEDHSKEEFPLNLKAFVLRQVSQALAYLHDQNPPLVHHDLSANNVLLNVVSFVTKVSDFGMSRAISPSVLSRKSSIKGTQAFMAPEALHDPPRYNEKLDVFSFGNIILSTLTHEWPNPGPPNRYEGDVFVAITELQRRERYIEMFSAQEKQLFFPTVCQCLENRPDKRPSSVVLVRELRHIESFLPRGDHVAAPIEQLRQQLSAKEEECRQKDEVIRVKVEELSEKDEMLSETAKTLRQTAGALSEKGEELQRTEELLREKDAMIRNLQVNNLQLRSQLDQATECVDTKDTLLVKDPLRDWRKLGECRKLKVIQPSPGGGGYHACAVAVNSEGLLAVTDGGNMCVHLLTNNGTLVRSIGKGVLGGGLSGIAFDVKGNVWVTDWGNKIVNFSQDGQFHQTICHAGSERLSNPTGVSVSPEGLIYISNGDSHRVTVHTEERIAKFLFAFGSKGSGPGCFDRPGDIAFGSDGLVYVVDVGNERVSVWSKQGMFKSNFQTKHAPTYIATTSYSDNHLLITSITADIVMVYTLEGELVHEFGGGTQWAHTGRFNRPCGICVDDSGLVYVADLGNKRVQIF